MYQKMYAVLDVTCDLHGTHLVQVLSRKLQFVHVQLALGSVQLLFVAMSE
jgi:hypothetical protein